MSKRHGIERVRPVERDDAGSATAFEDDFGVGGLHAEGSISRRPCPLLWRLPTDRGTAKSRQRAPGRTHWQGWRGAVKTRTCLCRECASMAIKYGRPIEAKPASARSRRGAAPGRVPPRSRHPPAPQPQGRLDAPAGARERADGRRPDLAAVPGRRHRQCGRRSPPCRASSGSRSTRRCATPSAPPKLDIPCLALFPYTDPDAARPRRQRGAQSATTWSAAPSARSRKRVPDIGILCDVALDPYTSHGHDGLLARRRHRSTTRPSRCWSSRRWSRREAGADIIAPSDMMDGRVGAIRAALDCGRLHRRVDHGLCGQIRLGLLRPVPRRGRLVERRWSATSAPIRWTRPIPTRRCARSSSTSPKAPTW